MPPNTIDQANPEQLTSTNNLLNDLQSEKNLDLKKEIS